MIGVLVTLTFGAVQFIYRKGIMHYQSFSGQRANKQVTSVMLELLTEAAMPCMLTIFSHSRYQVHVHDEVGVSGSAGPHFWPFHV